MTSPRQVRRRVVAVLLALVLLLAVGSLLATLRGRAGPGRATETPAASADAVVPPPAAPPPRRHLPVGPDTPAAPDTPDTPDTPPPVEDAAPADAPSRDPAARSIVVLVTCPCHGSTPDAGAVGGWRDAVPARATRAGEVRLDDAPAGRPTVRAFAPGHVRSRWALAETRDEAVATVSIALDAGGALEGRVVEPDGTPVAAATLDLRAGRGSGIWGDPPLATATSGPDGAFALDGVPREGSATLVARAFAHADEWVPLDFSADGARPVDVVLAPACEVTGRVLDAAGAPVAGARVRAASSAEPVVAASALAEGDVVGGEPSWVETRTADDGTFRLRCLTLGVTWLVHAHTRRTGRSPVTTLDPAAPPPSLELRLPVPGRVVVVVRDAEGALPEDTQVRLGVGRLWGRAASVEGPGRFVLDDVAAGAAAVRVEATDRLPVEEDVEVREGGETLVEVVLARGLAISGRVVEAGGDGVAGARITVRTRDASARSVRATCDGDGRFVVAGLPAGRVQVTASAPTHAPAVRDVELPCEDVELTLDRLATLTWRVRLPVPVARRSGNVLEQTPSGEAPPGPYAEAAWGATRARKMEFVDGVATVTWHALGPTRVIAVTGDHAPAVAFADARGGETIDLGEALLGPGRTARGRAVDERGAPVAAARVRVVAGASSAPLGYVADADGRFELPNLGPGPVTFQVSAAGRAAAEGSVPAGTDAADEIVVVLRDLR